MIALMYKYNKLFLGVICLFILLSFHAEAKIEAKGDWIYVDGVKFLIKGIGYSPFRMQFGYEYVPDSLIEQDFKRIKEAGFNTIRTWGIVPERVLKLAKENGLMVILGVWIESAGLFDNPAFIQNAIKEVRKAAKLGKNYDNIIAYLVMSEPKVDAVLKAGIRRTETFQKKLVNAVHQVSPNALVSISNWIKTSWLDMTKFDISCYNLYGYDFDASRANIGIGNYVAWLKSKYVSKPLIVTEFGYSVSPQGDGSYGYGGNTVEEQTNGIVKLYKEIIQNGACGACVFEWNDEWWKSGNPFVHDPTPEEWFGLLEVGPDNLEGTPRPAFYAMKDAFKVTVIEPKDVSRITGEIQFEINTLPTIESVEYRVGNDEWNSLSKETNSCWWKGVWNSARTPDGEKVIQIRGCEGKEITKVQELHVWTYNEKAIPLEPIFINVETDKKTYNKEESIKLSVTISDQDQKPVNNYPVNFAFEQPYIWDPMQWQAKTDNNGKIDRVINLPNSAGYCSVFIGANYEKDGYCKTFTKILQFQVGLDSK